MPMYSYKCPGCGHKQIAVKTMAESDTIENCDDCQEIMNRDLQADIPHAASDRYDKPIISDSLAIGMDQIAEHKAQYPDIEVTSEGQLVFDKYSTHQKYLTDTGHIKHPGKRINNSGKTVTTMADIRKKLTTTV